MIQDKFIPLTLAVISLVLFLSGIVLTILEISVFWALSSLMVSPFPALAGLINGIVQIIKRKTNKMVITGTILAFLELLAFGYVVLILAFYG